MRIFDNNQLGEIINRFTKIGPQYRWEMQKHLSRVYVNDELTKTDTFYSFRGTGGRRKISLPVYAEDESNDLSDLGIGTSSASGKSSMSEDFDNHSVIVSSNIFTSNR